MLGILVTCSLLYYCIFTEKMLDASTFSMRVNPSTDSAQNAYQIFLEALVLFIAGAVGMLLPLLALSSGSVSLKHAQQL